MTEATEEIKEILDRFNKGHDELKHEEYIAIDNYIKELQQDLDKAIDTIEKDRQFYKCRMDEYVKLKKENEILKENAEHNDKVVDKSRWNEMIYKSRCKKALNLVNNAIYENRCSCKYCNDYYLKELKNTLQGSDGK